MAYQKVLIREPTITISSDEDDKSPTWSIKSNNMVGRRLVRVAWDEAFDFCQEIVGEIEYIGSDYVYTMGQLWPYNKPTVKMRAVSAKIKAFGGSSAADTHAGGGLTKLINHTDALVEILYETRTGNLTDLVEESFEPTTEYLTIPNRKLYWDDPDESSAAGGEEELVTDEAPGKIVYLETYTYTIKQFPNMLNSSGIQGKVNSDTIHSLRHPWKEYEPGTLLFQSPDIAESKDYQGRPIYRFIYQMLYRPEGWNKFYKAGKTTPQVIYDADGEAEVYGKTAFQPYLLSTT